MLTPGACIFGTDGVRDRAGSGLLADAEIVRLLRAAAWTVRGSAPFPRDFPGDAPRNGRGRILIGRDTRSSGEHIEGIAVEALTGAGFDVTVLGVIPTPGVAYLASRAPDAVLGLMISASHNPAEYNGIKLLAPTGAKMTDDFERAVSDAYWESRAPAATGRGAVTHGAEARAEARAEALAQYVDHLIASSRRPERLRGRRIVLDTANGATHAVAGAVFGALGATTIGIGDTPDGANINDGCGALHPDGLARRILDESADFGFAFDGDGDRMIPVTATGAVLDGDHILAVAGRHYDRSALLPHRAIVSTVMANIGLEKALAESGLQLIRTAVGDRFVYDRMVAEDHPVGGEQSGHLIFLDHASTGDGLLSALRLIDCLEDGQSLDSAATAIRKYPQILLNYEVARKVPLEEIDAVQRAVAEAERELDGEGRIVLRYSGTEPLARVMVEGPETRMVEELARRIGEVIVAALG